MLPRLAAMACLPALAPGLSGEVAIAGEAAVLVGYVLPAFTAGLSGELPILTEAAFLVRYALPAFGCNRTLLCSIHGSKAAV